MESRLHHYESTINADSSSWKPLMESFDTNKSGSLEPDQLSKLLTVWNKGVEPTSEELALVISIADKDGTGGISIDQISVAGGTWLALNEDRQFINDKMKQFDSDQR